MYVNVHNSDELLVSILLDETSRASEKKKKMDEAQRYHGFTTGGEISIINDRVVKSCGAGFSDVYLIFMEVVRST